MFGKDAILHQRVVRKGYLRSGRRGIARFRGRTKVNAENTADFAVEIDFAGA